MENPASWKPVHHAISDLIKANKEQALLAYELVAGLRPKFLPKSVEDEVLIEAFDEAIWAHEEAMAKGRCGISLPMRLGNVIDKLKK